MATPHGRVVDHVVVDEGRRMGQLDRGGGVEMGLGQTAESTGQQHQRRTQPLPSRSEQLAHGSRQPRSVGRDRLPDLSLDAVEVLCDRPEEAGF